MFTLSVGAFRGGGRGCTQITVTLCTHPSHTPPHTPSEGGLHQKIYFRVEAPRVVNIQVFKKYWMYQEGLGNACWRGRVLSFALRHF